MVPGAWMMRLSGDDRFIAAYSAQSRTSIRDLAGGVSLRSANDDHVCTDRISQASVRYTTVRRIRNAAAS
jgi:hypothetical protein